MCVKKYYDEKTHIEGENFDFDYAWAINPITRNTPWAFLAQFKKVDEMAKLVRSTIRT